MIPNLLLFCQSLALNRSTLRAAAAPSGGTISHLTPIYITMFKTSRDAREQSNTVAKAVRRNRLYIYIYIYIYIYTHT